MRVVLVHRYFWPDTPPYANILRDIAEYLGKHGHEVVVLTCQPSYNRKAAKRAPVHEHLMPGVEVRRWSVLPDRRSTVLKAVNAVLFCWRIAWCRRQFGDIDVVMAASTPPILVAKAALWMARRHGARFFYHKQDVYPEVVVAPGIMAQGRLAALLRRVDVGTERRAERLVVLSEDMANTVRDRGSDPRHITVINNFDPWPISSGQPVGGDETTTGRPRSVDEPLRVVFAGNLGRFQNLETVLDAVVKLRDETRIMFDFFGDGPFRAHLERARTKYHLSQLRIHGYRTPEEVADFLRNWADLGIVSLAPGVIRAAYPSKTMSYLRNGCPVLALVEADSELAQTISSWDAGLHVEPRDSDALATLLRDHISRRQELADAGQKARALYRQQFDPVNQLPRWLRLFETVGGAAT